MSSSSPYTRPKLIIYQIPTEERTLFPPSPRIFHPILPNPTAYWHIRGSPLAFENIGFSKASDITLPEHAPGNSGRAGKVKFLLCAECDLGPVGWSFEGGSEAWLVVEQVRYGIAPT